jgi:hypothetical protein
VAKAHDALKTAKPVFRLDHCLHESDREILEQLPLMAETFLRAEYIVVGRHRRCNWIFAEVFERIFTVVREWFAKRMGTSFKMSKDI